MPSSSARRPGRDISSSLDDRTLTVRAQDGDLAAIEVLLRRYQRVMYRLALHILGDGGDAENVVQEAFLAAWRQLPAFRGDAAFSTWLYRIVTNRCLNALRAGRHRREHTSIDDMETTLASAGPSPASQVAAWEVRQALDAALGALPAEQRVCWVLREGDGLGYQDIAAVVGSSPDAVRGQIHRARRNLASRMKEWR